MENRVSLLMPVYNVAKLMKQNLKKSYNALLKLHNDFEIIIVDDNSTDKSYRFGRIINKAKRATGKDIKYISCSTGPSRRENLAKSFDLAKYEIVCFIDADFSCDISFALKAIKIMNEVSPDIVVGSRYIKGAKAKRSIMRGALSFFYNLFIRLLFKSKIRDHQCGLKVFRKSTTIPIIHKMGFDEKFVRGWFWDAELLIRAQKEKLKIIEMPVTWKESDTSAFDIRRELKCLKAIFRLKRELG